VEKLKRAWKNLNGVEKFKMGVEKFKRA